MPLLICLHVAVKDFSAGRGALSICSQNLFLHPLKCKVLERLRCIHSVDPTSYAPLVNKAAS